MKNDKSTTKKTTTTKKVVKKAVKDAATVDITKIDVIPENIHNQAKEYLKNLIKKLKAVDVYDDIDNEAIKMLGYNLSSFYEASDRLCSEGYTVTSDRGNVSPSPWVRIQKDSQASAMKVMQQFGLTLKARQDIKALDSGDKDDSPLDKFLKKEIR